MTAEDEARLLSVLLGALLAGVILALLYMPSLVTSPGARPPRPNRLTQFFCRLMVRWVGKKFPSTPSITTHELEQRMRADSPTASFLLLDCRSKAEYSVSKISGAKHVRFNGDDEELRQILDDNVSDSTESIICYCSVGYRSSFLADRINRAEGDALGRRDLPPALNVEGSIFQWANEGRPMVDSRGEQTFKMHPFNRVFGLGVSPSTWQFENA